MDTLEARKAELTAPFADAPDDTLGLLPSASAIYAKKIMALTKALNRSKERQEAAQAVRSLIEKIVLTPGPEREEIYATLHGELSAILNWVKRQAIGKAAKKNTPEARPSGVSVSVVAGIGFEPMTFRL